MWGQPVLGSPRASRSWREQQSTTTKATDVYLGGTEGVISDTKNGAKFGVGHSELPTPEEMWVYPGLDIPLASGSWVE